MIRIVERKDLPLWRPMVQALVDQENSRGDNLVLPNVLQDLLQGGQMLVAVENTAGETLILLLVQEVKDRLRPMRLLYINNFWMPSKEAFLAADLTEDKAAFAALLAGYDKVLFQTRNAALVRFLQGIGLTPQMEGMIYSLSAQNVEGGT